MARSEPHYCPLATSYMKPSNQPPFHPPTIQAVLNPEYAYLIPEAVKESKKRGVMASTRGSVIDPSRPHSNIADILAVNIGAELLDVVPGRVSTEVAH